METLDFIIADNYFASNRNLKNRLLKIVFIIADNYFASNRNIADKQMNLE